MQWITNALSHMQTIGHVSNININAGRRVSAYVAGHRISFAHASNGGRAFLHLPNESRGVERRVEVNLFGHLKLLERRNKKFEEVTQTRII